MTARILMYSHNQHSRGARDLSRALGIQRIRHEGSRYRARAGDFIINWGASEMPQHVRQNGGWNQMILNPDNRVRDVSDKARYLLNRQDGNRRVIPACSSRVRARRWIRDGHKVVCRTLTRASGGRGIVIAETEDALVDAPLYTKYVKKKSEFRAHFLHQRVFDWQEKRRRREADVDNQVRNYENGWVYCREDLHIPDAVQDAVYDSVLHERINFGAIDVIYNEHYDKAYVLEINTAPGLDGSTLDKWTDAFNNYLDRNIRGPRVAGARLARR